MQEESRTFWLGGESVNTGTEALTEMSRMNFAQKWSLKTK